MMICAALSKGSSTIRNLLQSQDLSLTTQALAAMGADIKVLEPGLVAVQGFNGRPVAHEAPIFLGNSGTSMRLLAGIAALGQTRYTLTGDKRMCERPMIELLDALNCLEVEAGALNPEEPPCHHPRAGEKRRHHHHRLFQEQPVFIVSAHDGGIDGRGSDHFTAGPAGFCSLY